MPDERAAATIEGEIQAMVDRETAAWNAQDADALVSLFHPDMVWPWPADARGHDPAGWVFPQGRYDRARWKAEWEELFRTYELVHNRRSTVRIAVAAQGDGAFAVVDVDTLWRGRAGAGRSTGRAEPARATRRSPTAGFSSSTRACSTMPSPSLRFEATMTIVARWAHGSKTVRQ